MYALYLLAVSLACLSLGSAGLTATKEEMMISCQDGADIVMNCPGIMTVQVLEAFYGRDKRELCETGDVQMDGQTDCSLPSAFRTVDLACSGLQTCTVRPTTAFFGVDPCPGTRKYARINYRCIVLVS